MKTAKTKNPAYQNKTISSSKKAITELDKVKKTTKLFTSTKENKQQTSTATTKESDMGIHLTQILNYYRERVEAFEKDRTQWYDKLEKIKVK